VNDLKTIHVMRTANAPPAPPCTRTCQCYGEQGRGAEARAPLHECRRLQQASNGSCEQADKHSLSQAIGKRTSGGDVMAKASRQERSAAAGVMSRTARRAGLTITTRSLRTINRDYEGCCQRESIGPIAEHQLARFTSGSTVRVATLPA